MRARCARPRSKLAPFVAIAVAFATFGAQLASLEHLASERHVVCKEHGELEDAPVVAAAGAVSAQGATVGSTSELPTRHGHEHCVFASHARQSTTAGPGRVLAAAAVFFEGSAPARLAPPPAPLPVLYRLAPKTSPPRSV